MIEHIKFEDLSLPDPVTVDRDPREYPLGEMWRDTLWRQLKFELLQVDFQTMMTFLTARELKLIE